MASAVRESRGPRYGIYGKYPCCIPGCTRHTLARRYHLCQDHWREYGGTKETRPEWLKFLIAQAEREYYAQDRDEAKTVSLEFMIGVGQIDPETMVIFTGAPNKERQKRRRRGRPRKHAS